MQSRITSLVKRGQLKSCTEAAQRRLLCAAPTGRSGDPAVHSGDLEGEDADQAALAANATKPPPQTKGEEADPLAPPKAPHSTPMLKNPGPSAGPLQGHQKIQKRSFSSSGKRKPTEEEVAVWLPEQVEHAEETMIRRAMEIWQRNKMRGDPNSPQSKVLTALRGQKP